MAIKESIFIKTNSKLKDITYEAGGNSWYLNFDNDISFSLGTIWRLFDNDNIKLISTDHGHQFGLPKPVDLVADLKTIVGDKSLTEIKIEKDTGDLILTFDNNIKLICYITSMGYESYEVFAKGQQYIAQGGGDITIFNLINKGDT